MCMLVSHTDDSGSDRQGPIFVLAGYVSTVNRWKDFSDAWDGALKSGPRPLPYFKMQHAAFSNKGVFKGWTKSERDKKIMELANIVKSYAMFGVCAALWWDEFAAVQKKYPHYPINPYSLLFNYTMFLAITHVMHLKLEETIDFVFDEQGQDGRVAYQSYEFAKVTIPSGMLQYIAGPPSHKSDRIVLPLQAADMLAWQSRRFCAENEKHGKNFKDYKFHPAMKFLDDIPMEQKTLDTRKLERFFAMLDKNFPGMVIVKD
jgi:hypothetical protein